jgi:hypothetical protein
VQRSYCGLGVIAGCGRPCEERVDVHPSKDARFRGRPLGRSTSPDPVFLAETPDDSLISVVETGRGRMKPFADKPSHEEILAIVRFLRTFEVTASLPRSEVP